MRADMLISMARGWWRQNGYNISRWASMPQKQKMAIALSAQRKGWPIKDTNTNKESEQLALF